MNLTSFKNAINYASYLNSNNLLLFKNSNYTLFVRRFGTDYITITKAGSNEVIMPPMENDGRRISTFNLTQSDFVNHELLTGYRKNAYLALVESIDVEKLDNLVGDFSQAFKPTNIDMRKRRITKQVIREGQQTFRENLLLIYERKCMVTGCNIESVLEAAHIIPYNGPKSNHPQNGLLLRSDIHILFDLYLMSIDPESMTVILNNELEGSDYWNKFMEKSLNTLPKDIRLMPSTEAITLHHREFKSRNQLL